jgi:chromosomal replication initiation ATPase DnaA
MKCLCPHCSGEINLSIFLNREVKKKNTDPEELKWIAEIVCNNAGISLEDFRQIKQTRDLVKTRQQFMWLVDKYTDYGPKITAKFIRPDMNHSTAIHGVHVINDLIKTSNNDKLEIEYLCDQIEQKLLIQKAS